MTVKGGVNDMIDEIKGKKLLVMRGDAHSSNIVRVAKKNHVYTMVADYYSDSPAKKLADESFMTSVTDIDEMVALIYRTGADGLISGFNDDNAVLAQKICKKACIPFYGTEEQIKISTDKRLFKQMCEKHSIQVIPEYYYGNMPDEDALRNIEYPAVIKPVDGSGSRGVTICFNEEEMKNAFSEALKYSKQKKIVIEKYMTGADVLFDFIAQDGTVMLSAMADKIVTEDRKNTPINHANLLKYPSEHLACAKKVAEQLCGMFESEKFNNGVIFVQAFYQDNQFYICEMGYRMGGTFAEITEAFCGYSPLEYLIDFQLTGHMGDRAIKEVCNPKFDGVGGVLSILLNGGVITSIKGLEKIESRADVVNIIQTSWVGDTVNKGKDLARIYLKERRDAELKAAIEEIYKELSVVDCDGKEMLMSVNSLIF